MSLFCSMKVYICLKNTFSKIFDKVGKSDIGCLFSDFGLGHFQFFIKFISVSYRFQNATSYPSCLFMFIFIEFYYSS